MAAIQYFTEKISFRLFQPRKTSSWLQSVAVHNGFTIDSLTYVFCSDAFLGKMNEEFLGHRTLTDIISFDLSESGSRVIGEIYISVPRVRENARKFNQPFEIELRRVLVHGLLHFMGFKDKSPAEKAQMRSKEEASLSLWK
ncbi:MAG TPA: rRNA maturation RNase YbeY [Cyclobacteriaceae bacterium]|nr:rRNA maturation RNase YbeY [Cyclobacteriaceae bacterium]HQQ95666.1 rRNA maturation RNase YbeY [Cyclobacteriaceae bacterium]